ncbi:MAG: MmcQ/YjbR family DNA-binding protein [Actinomycetota bacterium]|nr:MmcQ/YjbR family DNA-binding protein [Actinomycetota bacterium]
MTPAERPSAPEVWERLRAICLAMPDTSERVSHGELTWFVGAGKRARQFATTWDHHPDDRNAVVFAAPPGAQEQLIAADPSAYFRPPYVGGRGWVGAYLDRGPIDWDVIELHLGDAHAHTRG